MGIDHALKRMWWVVLRRHKLNDAITLHEIHDQAQEKAALIKSQVGSAV